MWIKRTLRLKSWVDRRSCTRRYLIAQPALSAKFALIAYSRSYSSTTVCCETRYDASSCLYEYSIVSAIAQPRTHHPLTHIRFDFFALLRAYMGKASAFIQFDHGYRQNPDLNAMENFNGKKASVFHNTLALRSLEVVAILYDLVCMFDNGSTSFSRNLGLWSCRVGLRGDFGRISG